VLGNVNILDACVAHRPSRYVFASTLYVYSRAGGFYRCSKQASEAYIEEYSRQHGLEYTVLRYGSLYGPRSDERNGIHRFVNEALRDGRIVYHGTPDALREYIHVRDAAEASVEVLEPRFANQHVILSGTQAIRIQDLFRMIGEIIGSEVKVDYILDSNAGHYETTPYSYHPKVGLKLVPRVHVDLGQGLVMKIEEAHEFEVPPTNVAQVKGEGR
jgi:UDP-glucose 4-epimerase